MRRASQFTVYTLQCTQFDIPVTGLSFIYIWNFYSPHCSQNTKKEKERIKNSHTTSAHTTAANDSRIMLSIIITHNCIANPKSACYLRNSAKFYAHMHQRYQLMTSYVSSAGCRAHAFHIAHKAHGQSHFELNLI